MKKHSIICDIQEYTHSELNNDNILLLKEAYAICKNAYAPYSKFKVGAALILENNTIITGSNQENVAYPSGTCAERVAIFYAGSNFPNNKIRKMAIVTHTNFNLKKPIMPCGSCRQAMIEYETKQGSPIEILLQGNEDNVFISTSVENLLPYAFNCEELKKL